MREPTTTHSPLECFTENYWRCVRELDILRLGQWELHKLTLPQLRILFNVSKSPGITVNELAAILGVTVSTTSGLVAKVVDRGLVQKRVAVDDRRTAPLELTETGRRITQEVAEAGDRFMAETAKTLGENLTEVTRALALLAEAAEQAHTEAVAEVVAP